MDAAVAPKVQRSSISYPQMVFQDRIRSFLPLVFPRQNDQSRLVLGGLWIAMLPIVGLQMLVVFLLAILLRANLPVIVALQWISNPLTMGPIYFADYQIGMTFLDLVGVDYQRNKLLKRNYDWSDFNFSDLLALVDTLPPMMIGGSIIGIFLGVVAVFLYKLSANLYKSQDEPSSDS